MKEQRQPAEIRNTGSEPACPPPDSQLAELIEVVWSCEVGHTEDRIEAAIKYWLH